MGVTQHLQTQWFSRIVRPSVTRPVKPPRLVRAETCEVDQHGWPAPGMADIVEFDFAGRQQHSAGAPDQRVPGFPPVDPTMGRTRGRHRSNTADPGPASRHHTETGPSPLVLSSTIPGTIRRPGR